MKHKIIYLGIIMSIIGLAIVFVTAQANTRISPRCNANGVVDVDYAYKIHSEEGYTNYLVVLTAGRCEKQLRGQIRAISNVQPNIEADIINQIENRQLWFYPDPFGELDVDGRGYFSIT